MVGVGLCIIHANDDAIEIVVEKVDLQGLLKSGVATWLSGAPVRIGDVAMVDSREALSTIVREDQQYIRQLSYDFRGPSKLARRTHTAFMKSLAAPAG